VRALCQCCTVMVRLSSSPCCLGNAGASDSRPPATRSSCDVACRAPVALAVVAVSAAADGLVLYMTLLRLPARCVSSPAGAPAMAMAAWFSSLADGPPAGSSSLRLRPLAHVRNLDFSPFRLDGDELPAGAASCRVSLHTWLRGTGSHGPPCGCARLLLLAGGRSLPPCRALACSSWRSMQPAWGTTDHAMAVTALASGLTPQSRSVIARRLRQKSLLTCEDSSLDVRV
jgi:hypothetical protein